MTFIQTLLGCGFTGTDFATIGKALVTKFISGKTTLKTSSLNSTSPSTQIILSSVESSVSQKSIRKGGEEVAHPIPGCLVPLFAVPITPVSEYMLQRRLRQICKRAGINLPYRGGYHSFRRRVATTVKHSLKSDIDTHKFMRWAEPRELGILSQYDQTRYEDVDKEVLEKHPVVKIWEEVCPYLLKLNSSYESFYDNAH